MAGGDFSEGGVGTDMAEKTREISRKLEEGDSIKTKTTGKTAVQREKRSESNLSNVRNTPFFINLSNFSGFFTRSDTMARNWEPMAQSAQI